MLIVTLTLLLQYRSMDNQGWWASFLYILLVLFVALIMMNLFTAVLKLRLAKAMSTLVRFYPLQIRDVSMYAGSLPIS